MKPMGFPTRRLKTVAGIGVFYVTAGVSMALLGSSGTYWEIDYFAIYTFFWPILITSLERVVEGLVGAGVGIGVLSLAARSQLPVTIPRFIPSLSRRRFAEFLGTLTLAELVSRLVAPLYFVAYVHLFPTFKGTPKTTIGAAWAYYRAGGDVIAARWGHTHFLLFGRLLKDAPNVLRGETEIAYAAYEAGNVGLFGGVGFAVLLGYPTALGLSYGLIRAGGRVVDRNSAIQDGE